MSPELCRIARRARAKPKERFTSLAHLLNENFLQETWRMLNRKGAAGIDRVSMMEYEENLEERLKALVTSLKAHRYRAPQIRRVYIPKAGNQNKLRPLGIPTVEDRLLQASVARILHAIYEADFLTCSYGYRPGRNPHQALAEIRRMILTEPIQWIYEADIRSFFDNLDHEWLMKMVELRVGDPWILRLIRKWLKAGIFDNGTVVRPQKGTPQGGPLSPVLANVYLHYALDLWFERAFKPTCCGKAFLIRFADDFIVLFGKRQDAERFSEAVEKRLAKFSLELAHEKTRLLPFGRKAWREGRKEHFDFLGFRHHMGTDRKGRMAVIRIPTTKSVRKFLKRVKAWLKVSIHLAPRQQQRKLNTMLRGFYHYFGLYHCYKKLYGVLREVMRYWLQALRRRSQRSRRTWKFYRNRDWFNLIKPRLIHPNI